MWALFCLATVSVVGLSSAQTFDRINQCPARSSNCHCEPTKIECIQRGLSAIPNFNTVAWRFRMVELGGNTITSVPANAFQHANVSEIYLNDNQIDTIATDAFSGLYAQLTVLDLANNQLTALSSEISKLQKLKVFDVSYNPIKVIGYRDVVMRNIGDYLVEFRFGDKVLEKWPESLHHLQALNISKFYGGSPSMDNIPINAFHSFEYTLTKLWIQNTSLISTPIALQYLKHLNEFHFDNNPLVGDAGILIPAFAGMTRTLETLSLKNNNLTTFPLVLVSLLNLKNLSLAGNSLEFVSDQAVGRVVSNLTTLDLTNCDLDRIPGALSRLLRLQNLDLSHNHLTTIEKNDLQLMNQLVSLDVSDNPLQYVSKSTFSDLRNLKTMIMQRTNLFNVPHALTNLPVLKELDLTNLFPSIECNCDLDWLYCYMQNNTNLAITGQCETVAMEIKNYVATKIPNECSPRCP